MMAFGGSSEIARLHTAVPSDRFSEVVAETCKEVGFEPSPAFLEAISNHPLVLRLEKWNLLYNRLQSFRDIGSEAEGLRQFFFSQHVLNDFPGDTPFDDSFSYPDDVRQIAVRGGEGLLTYGEAQFRTLASTCRAIAESVRHLGFSPITVLESPLGNVVPVRILQRLLEHGGVESECLTLSLPRNDRAKRGLTYREIIDDAARQCAAKGQRILYMDDVLTGSRFRKVVKALQGACKKYGAEEPIALAFVFTPFHQLGDTHVELRSSIQKLVGSQANASDLPVWNEMPQLPKLKIDGGSAVMYESPVIWGESDLVAGRRRVNLIFNLIEELRLITLELTGEDQTPRKHLRRLWSQDVNGMRYEIPDDVLQSALQSAADALDWNEIAERARKEFSDDYIGALAAPDDAAFVNDRVKWLRRQIVGEQVPGEPTPAQMLANALDSMFVAFSPRRGDPRDRDFCYMFYKYNQTIHQLHDTIVEETIQWAG